MSGSAVAFSGAQGFRAFRTAYLDSLERVRTLRIIETSEERREAQESQMVTLYRVENLVNAHPEIAKSYDELTLETPLHYLIKTGYLAAQSWSDYWPLFAKHRSLVVRLLIVRGADPNARDEDGNTPLLLAIKTVEPFYAGLTAHYNEEARIHLQGGYRDDVDREQQNSHREEPQCLICQALLRRGANPNIANLAGETPVRIALTKRRVTLLRELQQAGADLDISTPDELPKDIGDT